MASFDQDSTPGAGAVDPQIGDLMPAGHPKEGWIYAGISKTTYVPFYVAAKDSGVFKWDAAMIFAAQENARVPSVEELSQLFEMKDAVALKGTFNESGFVTEYWTSTGDRFGYAWNQRFSDGRQNHLSKSNMLAVRCVRS